MAKSFNELVKRTTTRRTRERAADRTRELLAGMLLSELRKLAGTSQRELADTLGIKQPSLSKLEAQSDMQISTLKRIVEALGGQLNIIAHFPKDEVRISQFEGRPRRAKVEKVRKLQLV